MTDRDNIDVIADRVDKIACRKCGRHLDVSKIAFLAQVECPDCRTRQTVPAQLGQFLLLELLGAGGMGAVYQALDKSLGRYVAIKVMRRALGDDAQFVSNFLREARAAAALNHRNVVQIYSCGQEKGQPYIVMELVSGGRLDEMVAQGNPLDEVRALEIGVDVAEGLKAANDVGLIHGDIKPANILFDKDGIAKVADFGLARFVTWQQERGEVWGTPYYIAPEKARGQKVDHRSDIYSLGATMYHALGAKPPFDGKTATDVVLARLKNPAIGLRVIRPTLQPETADVIARMLEADPFMRYPTYASLLADIREALRVAKQEQRSLRQKVKKTSVTPFAIIFATIAASVAILVMGLRWAQKREEKKWAEQAAAAATQRVVEVVAAPVPEVPKRTPPVVNPFTTSGEQALAAAIQQLVDGNPVGMKEKLDALYQESKPNGMGRYWIRLFQVVACWASGADEDATKYLNEIKNAFFESPDGMSLHPGNMVQTLAKFLLKECDENAVTLEASRWPPWFGDLSDFFMAADYLKEGNLTRAQSYFSSYLLKEGKEPAWPYSLRKVAQMSVDQILEFTVLQGRNREMIAAKQASKARAALEGFQFKASALLLPLIDIEMSKVRAAEALEQGEQQRVQRREHQKVVDVDLRRLEEVRAANLQLVTQKDFRKAAAAVVKAIAEMKTPEGRQTLVLMREAYDRMDGLKKFLISRLGVTPFKGAGTELNGDAVGADLNGVRVGLGQHGAMTIPWDQVSVRLLLQMANFYLADTKIPAPERADVTLSAAVYCYENAGFKAAAQYADQACKLDPQLKTKARRFMPDLLPD